MVLGAGVKAFVVEDVNALVEGVAALANMDVAGAALVVNKHDEGAELSGTAKSKPLLWLLLSEPKAVVMAPNMPFVLPLLFCWNELLTGGAPNVAAPPKAVDALPLVANGLLKLAAGAGGLKPMLWLPAPNAGNDELLKLALGAVDCAGGKLLVEPWRAEPVPFALLLATAGADAPKAVPSPSGSGAPKPPASDDVCMRASAICWSCLRRITRRAAAELYLLDMVGAARG
jgi:hypothetical protein